MYRIEQSARALEPLSKTKSCTPLNWRRVRSDENKSHRNSSLVSLL